MELTSFIHIAQILVAIVLIAIVLMQVKGTGVQAARALERRDRAREALRRPLDPGGVFGAQGPGAPERRFHAPAPGGVTGKRGDGPPRGSGRFAPRGARPEAVVERAEHVLDAPARRRLARAVLGEHARERLGQSLRRAVAFGEREHGG